MHGAHHPIRTLQLQCNRSGSVFSCALALRGACGLAQNDGVQTSPSQFEGLSLAALAWEMLRRSPGYQAAYAKQRKAQEVPSGASPPWGDGADWGLIFPG